MREVRAVENEEKKKNEAKDYVQVGLMFLGASLAVFVVCSLIQSWCGSSMFDSTYPSSLGFFQDLLVNLTFYPGWILTGVLGVLGVMSLYAAFTESSGS